MDGGNDGKLTAGERVGDLVVGPELGRGSFSTVYRAHDEVIGRSVALKVLRGISDDERFRRRTRRELRVMGALQSPHVVTLYRVHRGEGGAWMLELELVEGTTLAERVRRSGPLPAKEIRRVLDGVLRGLDAAHRHDVLHRDVKPENVLLGHDGSVKLTDFGFGRELNERALDESSQECIVGTPYYLAPEILYGLEAAPPSDLWSVGVLLHWMLAGVLPFEGRNLPALFNAIVGTVPAPLPPSTPPDLAAIVDACLRKDPAERAPTAAALLERLGASPAGAAPAVRADPTPSDPARTGAPVDLVGRDEVIRLLGSRLAEADAGQGRAVLVSGPGGVGKTALLTHLAGEARRRGALHVEAGLSPLGGVHHALLESLRAAIDPSAAPSGRAAVALSPEVFGANTETLRRVVSGDGTGGAQALVWAYDALLRGVGKERPVLLTIDGLQYADADGLRLVQTLVQRVRALRVLLVLGLRTGDADASPLESGDVARLAASDAVEHLPLRPLDRRHTAALAARVLGCGTLPAEVGRVLWQRTEGVPYLVLEYVRHLEETGSLRLENGAVQVVSSLAESGLPTRFHDLVASRTSGLSPSEHELLEAAAVGGLVFRGEELAAVVEQSLLSVLRTLQRIGRERQLVRPDGDAWRFDHALLRDAIYERTASPLRSAYHRQYALHMESRGDLDAYDRERLGLHWRDAGDIARASPHLDAAALAAVSRQEHRHAIELARTAGLLDPGAAAERLRAASPVPFRIVGALADVDRMDEAEALLARIGAAATTLGDAALAGAHAVWQEDLAAYKTGPSAVDAERLERVLPDVADWWTRARGHYLMAERWKTDGDLDRALTGLQEAERIHAENGSGKIRATVVHEMGAIAFERLDYDEARRRFEEAARLCEESFRPINGAVSRAMAGVTALAQGDMAAAIPLHERAAVALEDAGSRVLAACVRSYGSQALAAAGRAAEAATENDAALVALRSAPPSYATARPFLWGAHLAHAAGNVEQAADLTAAFEARVAASGDASGAAFLRAGLALYDTVDGRPAAAAERIAAALRAMAREGGTPHQRLELGVRLLECWALGCDCLGLPGVDEVLEVLQTEGEASAEVASAIDSARQLQAGEREEALLQCIARPFASGRLGERQNEHHALARMLMKPRSSEPAASDLPRWLLPTSASTGPLACPGIEQKLIDDSTA